MELADLIVEKLWQLEKLIKAHKEILSWPGRSAFREDARIRFDIREMGYWKKRLLDKLEKMIKEAEV